MRARLTLEPETIPEELALEITNWSGEENPEFKLVKQKPLAEKILNKLIELVNDSVKFIAYIKGIEKFVIDNSIENPLYPVMQTFQRGGYRDFVGSTQLQLSHVLAASGSLEQFEYCIKYNANFRTRAIVSGIEDLNLTTLMYAMENNKPDILGRLNRLKVDLHDPVQQTRWSRMLYKFDFSNKTVNDLYYPFEICYQMSASTRDYFYEIDEVKSIPRLDKILRPLETLWWGQYQYFAKKQIELAIFTLENYGLQSDPTHLEFVIEALEKHISLILKLPSQPLLTNLTYGNSDFFDAFLRRFRDERITTTNLLYLKALIFSLMLANTQVYSTLIAKLKISAVKTHRLYVTAAGCGEVNACVKLTFEELNKNNLRAAEEWHDIAQLASEDNMIEYIGIHKTIELAKAFKKFGLATKNSFSSLIQALINTKNYLSSRQLKEISFLIMESPDNIFAGFDAENKSSLALTRAIQMYYQAQAEANIAMIEEAGKCIESCFQSLLTCADDKSNETLAIMSFDAENAVDTMPINTAIYRVSLCLADMYRLANNPIEMNYWYSLAGSLPNTLGYISSLFKTNYSNPDSLTADEKKTLEPADKFLRFAIIKSNDVPFHQTELHRFSDCKIWLLPVNVMQDSQARNPASFFSESKGEVTLSAADNKLITTVKAHLATLSQSRRGLFSQTLVKALQAPEDPVVSLDSDAQPRLLN
jgi:hypothetical protein